MIFKLIYEILNSAQYFVSYGPFLLQTWLRPIPLVKIFAYHGYMEILFSISIAYQSYS
ncbi:hypothetical protein C0J52_16521 [Blattella germanica]|nr:hypothetical protein C0J52_16521 [Blattella germanica]